ncbi:hypothetical protein GGX14DRAFT_389364 [Mycena pura]|uniref:Uncharacterized protein n=1 Tax=Mycena pura TaxID=153505 RepID=A0AAD6VQD0_9AGAR|nr:hypothetical protein GGX14DRAFT_389364 [Mycena pura]
MLLQGIPSYYYGHSSRHALGIDRQLAICVGLFMSVRSSLHSASTLGGGGKDFKKYISAIPHAQEYEHMFAVFGMVFYEDKLTASGNKRKGAPSKASVQREGPARGSTSLCEVLPVGTKNLRMETDNDRLDAILPPYENEIPENSLKRFLLPAMFASLSCLEST